MATIRLDDTTVGRRDLEKGTREAWADALADPEVCAWLKRNGVADPASLADAGIEVSEVADGVSDAVGTVLITIASGVAVNLIGQLFAAFILPRLKERFGAGAVGEAASVSGD